MTEWTPDTLSGRVIEFVELMGASSVGIATLETLEGGPPSTDLTYVLPEARSAISFAVPLDQSTVVPFLSKQDRMPMESDNRRANLMAQGIAVALEHYLDHNGFKSKALLVNEDYREEAERGKNSMLPYISHRYLAARSGVGSFGLSGNILTKENGAGIILCGCVTSAELIPTEPVPPEDNYCDSCGLCMNSCLSNMMDKEEKTTIIMGDLPFSYSKRREILRCGFVCGGSSGLHPDGKWSTWSPGRFEMPEENEKFLDLMRKSIRAYYKRPEMEGGAYNILMHKKLYTTCGNCQFLCVPDKKERAERFKELTTNGVIIQNPDGTLERVSPEKAEEHIAVMDEETRALYM